MAQYFSTSRVVEVLSCFYVLNYLFLPCTSNQDLSHPFESLQHVSIVDSTTLETLKSTETLSLIYYNTAVNIPIRERFLQAFDDSAKYLKVYSIALAVVNCVESPQIDDECKGENVGNNVVTYMNGVELIRLELDTMFDINSIMANSLQLLLLREVPIIESQSLRETLQAPLLGKQDFIFFYTKAIGTLEHRVFMEIAYTYQDRYKFAVSTILDSSDGLQDRKTLKSNTKSALWTLYCSKSSVEINDASSICQSVLYRGIITLSTLADYMKRLPEPNLFYAPEYGTPSLFEMERDLPIIFIYTNHGLKQHSDDVSNSLAYDVKGFAKITVVDVDDKHCYEVASNQGFDGYIPRVSVAIPDGTHTFMEKQDQLNLSEIRHFLMTVATIPTKPGEEVVNATDSSVVERKPEDLINRVEVQDDEVVKDVFIEGVEKPKITCVPAILKGTFQDAVLNAQLKMVLYYLPYDSVSLAFLTDFEAAAKILASNKNSQEVLASVNCFDATDLCAKENITTYPVIRIHRKDMPYQTYEGPLDTDSIFKAVGLLHYGFPIMLEDEEELNRFISGGFPAKVTDFTPSSVLFLAMKEDTDTWTTFRTASRQLSPFVAMADVDGSLVDVVSKKFECPAPCVVSIHHSDTINPVRTMSIISGNDDVVGFVRQAMIVTMPELTAANFPTLHSKSLPFVILFLNQSNPESNEIRSTVADIASLEKFSDSIFCWMDAQEKTLGLQLLMDYTQVNTTPTMTVVNHKQAKVFTSQSETLAPEQIIHWLTRVFSDKESPSKMLEERKWSPPGPFYDFLTMIDKEIEQAMEEEQSDGKFFSSGFKVGLEKEDEVREKLLEQHRGHMNVHTQPDSSKDGESQNTDMTKQDENAFTHEHTEL